ncbi:MAG: FtsW/RodA/SpoVE family cell cycle protein [Treponema sp.]|nr:FtsW/RodA/SpoVE family cell cycle protein [Treponema sp.]
MTRERAFRYDFFMLAAILLLLLLGLVILYSASFLFASNQPSRFVSGWAPMSSNIVAVLIMLFLFPILSMVNLELFKKGWVVFFILLLTVAINILPFFPLFQKANHRPGVDAMRWIFLKFPGQRSLSFQPSELIKVALPLYLAYILDKNKDRLDNFFYGPLPPVVVTTFFCFLVLRQSNFSEAALIALISMVICFVSGIRLRWFAIALALMILVGYQLTVGNPEGRWYERIHNFISKAPDEYGEKYQSDLSLEAVKAGGFWGKGIGQGTLKIKMPEVHGDFVFASFVEESGFLGVLFYLVLIGFFAWIGYKAAWRSGDRYSQLLAFGLVTAIVIQSLLNIAVVGRIVPTTGIPLPFVSSGGSSLLATLISSALLVNITRRYVFMGGKYAR